jgi:hypothetical protein
MLFGHESGVGSGLRWSCGLSVMLKKTLGITLVTKLRAILLMEGNFNATNKIVYGVPMMSKT